MPTTNVVTVRTSMNKSGLSDKRYRVTTLAVPAQLAKDIPDKQRFEVARDDDGTIVFMPVKE